MFVFVGYDTSADGSEAAESGDRAIGSSGHLKIGVATLCRRSEHSTPASAKAALSGGPGMGSSGVGWGRMGSKWGEGVPPGENKGVSTDVKLVGLERQGVGGRAWHSRLQKRCQFGMEKGPIGSSFRHKAGPKDRMIDVGNWRSE